MCVSCVLTAVTTSECALPQGGTDVGDHPPITPVRAATEEELGGGDAWRLYDFVARHFLGSVSPDAVYKKWVLWEGGIRGLEGGCSCGVGGGRSGATALRRACAWLRVARRSI